MLLNYTKIANPLILRFYYCERAGREGTLGMVNNAMLEATILRTHVVYVFQTGKECTLKKECLEKKLLANQGLPVCTSFPSKQL